MIIDINLFNNKLLLPNDEAVWRNLKMKSKGWEKVINKVEGLVVDIKWADVSLAMASSQEQQRVEKYFREMAEGIIHTVQEGYYTLESFTEGLKWLYESGKKGEEIIPEDYK